MKNMYKLFILCCFIAGYHAQAKVITVSNREGDIAQHRTIESALSEAVDGDIIYVSPSPISYGNFEINKRVTLIGSGHNLNRLEYGNFISELGWISLTAGASGSMISGFRIQAIGTAEQAVSEVISNVTIKRNRILDSITLNGFSKEWVIEENVIYILNSLSAGITLENHVVRNNIFNEGFASGLSYSMFLNNIFYFSFIRESNFNTFSNNIFYEIDFIRVIESNDNRVVNSSFNNNIVFDREKAGSFPEVN